MGMVWQRTTGISGMFITVDGCVLRLTSVKCFVPPPPCPCIVTEVVAGDGLDRSADGWVEVQI